MRSHKNTESFFTSSSISKMFSEATKSPGHCSMFEFYHPVLPQLPFAILETVITRQFQVWPSTSSEKEHFHGQDDSKSAVPIFNQSNYVIYTLIQSEMEPQTAGPCVQDNAIFKKMCLLILITTGEKETEGLCVKR